VNALGVMSCLTDVVVVVIVAVGLVLTMELGGELCFLMPGDASVVI